MFFPSYEGPVKVSLFFRSDKVYRDSGIKEFYLLLCGKSVITLKM